MKNQDKRLKKLNLRKRNNLKLAKYGEELKKEVDITMTIKTIKRIKDCSLFLQFLADEKLEKHKLHSGELCGNRFCPICSKNKSVKDSLMIKTITDYVTIEHKLEYIFVTLTAPNVLGNELDSEIKKYNKAFDNMFRKKKYKNIIKGFIRKLEVTYNKEKDTYHPHFHILIAVNKSYFQGGVYIPRDEWLKDWQHQMKDSSITQVDVRRVKTKTQNRIDKSILEITKYVAKDSNYLENKEVFKYFYKGLKGKRIYSYGGLFKKARELYKKGELDKYKPEDETEWYYKITNEWQGKKYSEKIEIYEEQ